MLYIIMTEVIVACYFVNLSVDTDKLVHMCLMFYHYMHVLNMKRFINLTQVSSDSKNG